MPDDQNDDPKIHWKPSYSRKAIEWFGGPAAAIILRHPANLKELPVFSVATYFFVNILLAFVHLYTFDFCCSNINNTYINIFTYWFGHFDNTSAFLIVRMEKSSRQGHLRSDQSISYYVLRPTYPK